MIKNFLLTILIFFVVYLFAKDKVNLNDLGFIHLTEQQVQVVEKYIPQIIEPTPQSITIDELREIVCK